MRNIFWRFLILLTFLVACAPAPTVTSTSAPTLTSIALVAPTATTLPTATIVPTETATATNTRTPTATATNTNTATNTATATLTRTPTNTPMPTNTATPRPLTLRDFADKLGFKIGAFQGAMPPEVAQITGSQFNLVQIYNGWTYSEPTRGNFDLTNSKYMTAFASRNGMVTQSGMLIWPAELPDWVSHGKFNRDELITVMQDHIKGLMIPYKGKINEWFVVNETYNPPYYPRDLFYETIGPEYIEMAFRTARETDPSAILIYNNAENWTSNGISTHVTQQVVQNLKSKGLIDGVGLQMHLLMHQPQPPDKADVIATMKSYGVSVYVTEFDVNLKDIPGTQEQRFAFQAKVYKDMLEACIESGVCKSFTVFGVDDKDSVFETLPNLQYGYSPRSNPLLFDDNLNPKPAYYAIRDVLLKYAQK